MSEKWAAVLVSVGKLPDWYDEGEHDAEFEIAIERYWNPNYPSDREVTVEYNYEQTHVTAYDGDGNVVFERDDHDLDYAFKIARNSSRREPLPVIKYDRFSIPE